MILRASTIYVCHGFTLLWFCHDSTCFLKMFTVVNLHDFLLLCHDSTLVNDWRMSYIYVVMFLSWIYVFPNIVYSREFTLLFTVVSWFYVCQVCVVSRFDMLYIHVCHAFSFSWHCHAFTWPWHWYHSWIYVSPRPSAPLLLRYYVCYVPDIYKSTLSYQ